MVIITSYVLIHCNSHTSSLIVTKLKAAERGGGVTGAFALGPTLLMGPKRSIYPNRTVKYSIKAVTTYILPWAPQALSAALTKLDVRVNLPIIMET